METWEILIRDVEGRAEWLVENMRDRQKIPATDAFRAGALFEAALQRLRSEMVDPEIIPAVISRLEVIKEKPDLEVVEDNINGTISHFRQQLALH